MENKTPEKKDGKTIKKSQNKIERKSPSAQKKKSATPKKQKAKTLHQSETKRDQIKKKDIKQDKSILTDAAENIEIGAKVVGEKATEIVLEFKHKTSQLTENIFEKMKHGFSDVYDSGSLLVDSLSETVHDYTKKYKHKAEIKRLVEKQDLNFVDLGMVIYDKMKLSEYSVNQLFKEQKVRELNETIASQDKEIIKLGKKLDKIKN